MAWIAVDKNGREFIYMDKPNRGVIEFLPCQDEGSYIELPQGSIKKLIGRELSWNDEPVGLKSVEI